MERQDEIDIIIRIKIMAENELYDFRKPIRKLLREAINRIKSMEAKL